MVGQSSTLFLVVMLSKIVQCCYISYSTLPYVSSLNQGCFCCYAYMVSCVPGPADDHAGHCNPAANVVFLPSDRPGPPVTTYTASPYPESSESTHTLQFCPVDEYEEASKQIRDTVLQQTHTFCFPFLYRLKRLNSQHTSLLLYTEK